MEDRLLVGTRGSSLALAQARLVLSMLEKVGGGKRFEIVPIKTAGDLSPQGPRGETDGKTAFTREIERQLADGKVDLAVHSMKDLPTATDGRLVIAATPPRGDARDALVTISGSSFSGLDRGAKVGTSSPRRRAQLLASRRDIKVVELHGNVETRLRKLQAEDLDGVVLAAVGLQRLGLGDRITQVFTVDEMTPAPCQGILAVQAAKDNTAVLPLLKKIDHAATRAASECERAFSEALGGDCEVPLGAFASADAKGVSVVGVLADLEGTQLVRATASGGSGHARELGRELAAKVKSSGGERILRRLRR